MKNFLRITLATLCLTLSAVADQFGPVGPPGPATGTFALAQVYSATTGATNFNAGTAAACTFNGATTNGSVSGILGQTNISSTLSIPSYRQATIYCAVKTTNTTSTATPGVATFRFQVSPDGGTTWTTSETNTFLTPFGKQSQILNVTVQLRGTNVTCQSISLDAGSFNAIRVGSVENTDTNGITPTVTLFVK